MKFLYIVVGIAVVAVTLYTVVLVFQALFGLAGVEWSDVTAPVLVMAGFYALMIVGYFYNKNEEALVGSSDDSESTSDNGQSTQTKPSFNPLTDKLDYSVYRQTVKSWWSDNDGDSHTGDSFTAYLRFYHEGTVIAVRSEHFPKKEMENSFNYSGSFQVHDNHIEFELHKVREVADAIVDTTTAEERRTMKYTGYIAQDDDLIKAGPYKGIIKGSSIDLGNHDFHKVPYSTLIITASEADCDVLDIVLLKLDSVIETYQNTGNWYSNGETGPEWFTVHVDVAEDKIEEFERELSNILSERDMGVSQYWA